MISHGEIPVLETERLLLRECRREDFAAFYGMRADPDVMKFIGGEPMTEEDAWTKFLRTAGHWQIMGFGYWMVEERTSGRVIGEIGFSDLKRGMIPTNKGEPEAGWILASAGQGKGYATEAVMAAVNWGDEYFNGARMSCIIDPENVPSLRLAETCGFKQTGIANYHGSDIFLLHREPG